MKTTRVEKAIKCDKCGEVYGEYEGETCLGCGKDFCCTCADKHGESYQHSVYCSGGGDGFYCKPCDKKLHLSGDKLHAAYLQIRRLRVEDEDWTRTFNERRKAAEDLVESLQ